MPFDKWIRLLNSNYYIYTYYFIYDLRVFNFLHKKGIHLQRVTALTINFQFNSISHRVRFDFNGISFSLHIELLEIYRELMCIVGCWWCTQRPQKAIWDSEKYLISVKETKQPWIWKFSLLHHGGSLQVAKWKGGTGAEIRPWSVTPRSKETTISWWQVSFCHQHVTEDSKSDAGPARTGGKRPHKVFLITSKVCSSRMDGFKYQVTTS